MSVLKQTSHPFLLSQLGAHIAREFQRRTSATGVEPRTYAVLMALATEDGQSQRQLSARLGIRRNAMVSVIDALEADGLVKRTAHPDDRRAFAITLADQARSLLPDLDKAATPWKTRSQRHFRPSNETPCAKCCNALPLAQVSFRACTPTSLPASKQRWSRHETPCRRKADQS